MTDAAIAGPPLLRQARQVEVVGQLRFVMTGLIATRKAVVALARIMEGESNGTSVAEVNL